MVAYSDEELLEAAETYSYYGSQNDAASALGMSRTSLRRRLTEYHVRSLNEKRPAGGKRTKIKTAEFSINKEELLDETAALEDILTKRRAEFRRRRASEESRFLIRCRVRLDGPIGILHMGDPHVDDPGTSIDALERHINLIQNTEGLFGANVGDLANHWVGRLARLHAHQTTTEAEAWRLVEWLVTSVDWLYIIGGNHDLWVGDGDPVEWMVRNQSGVYQAHGARINLIFPNKKMVRVNARHDWSGHSQWNSTHGPSKAAQMGIDDHIVISGHRHISGYQIIKQQNSGLISHALRVASYKIYDNYGKQLGLRNQNVSPAVITVINPEREDDDPGLITVFHDIDTAVDFLNFLRQKKVTKR